MSGKNNQQQVRTASMSFMLEPGEPDAAGLKAVPTEAHLLPPGPFRAVDGRPYDCEAWALDAVIAKRVIERMAAQKNDVLIDYEHQSLLKEINGQPAPASGWFKALAWRDAGLYATGIAWTADAAECIAETEYRYISAVFTYYPSTGEVLEIISVALTNTPALDGLDALSARAALSRSVFSTLTNSTKDSEMDKDQQIAALTAERDAFKAQVAPAATSMAALTAQVAALTSERDTAKTGLAALTAQAEKDKHGELMTAALTDGRLAPAQKPWAEKQSLAVLAEFLDATAPLVNKDRQAPAGAQGGGAGLSEVELAACTHMGVTPEAFLVAKK